MPPQPTIAPVPRFNRHQLEEEFYRFKQGQTALNCPFCGHAADGFEVTLYDDETAPIPSLFVTCINCFAQGPDVCPDDFASLDQAMTQALDDWNDRVEQLPAPRHGV
jgi:hypothetical protein